MANYTTFPDVDYTALIAEITSYVTNHPDYIPEESFGVEMVTSEMIDQIPSLTTTFASLNLSVKKFSLVKYNADSEAKTDKNKRFILIDDLMLIPLTDQFSGSCNFFEAAPGSLAQFDTKVAGPYYDAADCTLVDSLSGNINTGYLLKPGCITRFENNTDVCNFIFIIFNRIIAE